MATSTERVRALRARRRAALEADPAAAALRDAEELLVPAVEQTLAALDLDGKDAGLAQMARQLARVIDQAKDPAWAARWLMPELLRVLDALHATPLSRAKVTARKDPARRLPNRVQQLRAAHQQATGRHGALGAGHRSRATRIAADWGRGAGI